uniref:Uncharacterized protein n=1 Tax=Lepeophtheirus salmonis TaxID=72036 RepID=A0A0K2TMR5_LEPSM
MSLLGESMYFGIYLKSQL